MKTVEERATEYLQSTGVVFCDDDVDELVDVLNEQDRESRVDQDQLTRHACADAVIKPDVISDDYWEHINKSNAHDACINTKAI